MGSGLDVGSRVGDTYEITRLVGRGGMGEVWLARHLRLPGKQVAIKVLHIGAAQLSADALARFRREAEVATRIGHPNIVEVHDFNTLPNGAPYLVLEFLQGESLGSRLRHPIELAETQAILRQVGSALQAAHAHGVVHRDLKPDNIFLVASPLGTTVKVLDFGISKVIHSSTLQTQESVLVGTPAYMSPEQAAGNNKDVGPQSDVFALGAIAYEMLAGKQAFHGESIAQIVMRIAYEPHPPLAEVKPGLPSSVVAAVERALVKDRAQRTADVAAFVLELTGEPLPPMAARVPDEQVAPSGVATPGMSTPDSLMLARTAAPTPVSQPPVAALVKPTRGLGAWVWVGLGLVGVAAVVSLQRPVVEERKEEPVAPVVVAAPVDAGAMVPEPPPPPTPPVAPAPPPVAPRRLDPKLVLPPAAERSQLAVLEALVQQKNFRAAANEVNVAMRLQLSEVGNSWAALLSTEALCGNRSLEEAKPKFRQITEPSHVTAAQRFCAEYGLQL